MLKADLEVSLAEMNTADSIDKASAIHTFNPTLKTFLKLGDGHGMKVPGMRRLALLQVAAEQAGRAQQEARTQLELRSPTASPARKKRSNKK
jgi:hypothetical protein